LASTACLELEVKAKSIAMDVNHAAATSHAVVRVAKADFKGKGGTASNRTASEIDDMAEYSSRVAYYS